LGQGNFLNAGASDFRCRSKVTEQYCTVFFPLQLQYSYPVPTPNAAAAMPDHTAKSPEGSTPSHAASAPCSSVLTDSIQAIVQRAKNAHSSKLGGSRF